MDMVQKLQLVVDATTGASEARFQALTRRAQDTGDATVRAASSVADAADRVLAAQARQADAAKAVEVAQLRLQELQEKGSASASQLARAEGQVESAQRKLHLATREAEQSTESQTRAMAQAEDQAGQTDRAVRDHGAALDDLKGKVVGLVAGYSLADYVRDSVVGFANGARAAQGLATSMNATVEQGGQLAVLFGNLGLEADDLLEIQAEFAQKIEANADALGEFGAEVKTNTDGTTNWALTLVDALTQLQKIPDATERNRRGFALFGEEGYKQLSRLLNSGVSVEDALARIGVPFDAEDVRATQEYDQAMADLSGTAGGLQRDLGRELLPVVTALVTGFGSVVDVVGAIPGPMMAAAAVVVALALAKRSATTEGGLLAGALTAAQGAAARFTAATGGAAAGAGVMGTAMAGARVAGAGLMGIVGGPLGVAILALGAGFSILNAVTGDNGEEAEAAAQANEDLAQALRESNGVVTESVRRQAALSAQQAGLLEVGKRLGLSQGEVTRALLEGGDVYDELVDKVNAYIDASLTAENAGDLNMTRNADDARGFLTELEGLRGTTQDTAEAERELAGELNETTDKAALAEQAMDALTSALEDGDTTGRAFTDTVKAAAEAQIAQDAASDQATAAIDAYRATTDQAVQATLDLISAQLSAEDAEYGYLDAMDELKTARDDDKTSVDEVAQAHTRYKGAALDAATAAADAALQAAKAAGTVVGPLDEANVRADAMLANLREKLNAPGLSEGARADLQGLIDQLQTAKDKGDVNALVTLTGADEAGAELDETTEDREATVTVESRNGPAVDHYLDGLASATRLAIIRVESRNGPAVQDYLEGLSVRDRLAIIRVESRGGPAVWSYLDSIAAADRLAIIRVETRGGPDVDRYLDSLANQSRTAVINVRRDGTGAPGAPTGAPALYGAPAVGVLRGAGGDVTVQQLVVQVQGDGAGRISQQSLATAGRDLVRQLGAYTRQNGNGWLKGLDR